MSHKKIIVILIAVTLVFWMFGFKISDDLTSSTALQQFEIQDTASISDSFSRSVQGSISQGTLEPVSLAGHQSLEKDYITDMYGRTLYIKKGPVCVGGCLVLWPPYRTDTMISKSDGKLGTAYNENIPSLQYTWDGNYLYYYAEDKNPGDIKGNGVGGVWSVIEG